MTARRKFKSLLLLLVLLVLCAGLLTAAKGKAVSLATGEMGEPSEAPLANASVCVEEGRGPGRWRLPGVLHRGRWGEGSAREPGFHRLLPTLGSPASPSLRSAGTTCSLSRRCGLLGSKEPAPSWAETAPWRAMLPA